MNEKKLRRGAYFTDIHFGKKANSISHNQDCKDFVAWFCDEVRKDPTIDYVAFLGDWNENRSSLNIATLKHSYEAAKMLNELGLPVFFVVGNHDLYYRHSREIHSIVPFNEFSNFVVIDQPMVIDQIEGKALFSPFLFPEEYKGINKYLNIPFWAGHFEFKGFVVTGYNITMPTGPDPKEYVGPKNIVSGHFHKRQVNDNIVYIGNTFPMDFGDTGDSDRGMMIYDHIDDEMWFENWDDCPLYIRTTLSDILERESERSNILRPKSRVKCTIDIPISYEESTYLREKFIEEYDIREFVMEESLDIKSALSETETDIDWESEKLLNVNDLVLKMLTDIESPHIQNDLLIDIYKGLKIANPNN